MFEQIFDSVTLNKLRQIHERIEIRDEAGELVGYFTPPDDRSLEASLYRDVEVPFTDEDLDRFEQEPGGFTLDEILAELNKES